MYDTDGPDAVVLSPVATSYTVEEGNSISPITCSCEQCSPNCSARWVFKNYSSGTNSVLHLDYVSRNASGQYSCHCINTDTSDEKSKLIDVTVECKKFKHVCVNLFQPCLYDFMLEI